MTLKPCFNHDFDFDFEYDYESVSWEIKLEVPSGRT